MLLGQYSPGIEASRLGSELGGVHGHRTGGGSGVEWRARVRPSLRARVRARARARARVGVRTKARARVKASGVK